MPELRAEVPRVRKEKRKDYATDQVGVEQESVADYSTDQVGVEQESVATKEKERHHLRVRQDDTIQRSQTKGRATGEVRWRFKGQL